MIKYIFTIAIIILTNIITALVIIEACRDIYDPQLNFHKRYHEEYKKAYLQCVRRLRKYEDKDIDYPNS